MLLVLSRSWMVELSLETLLQLHPHLVLLPLVTVGLLETFCNSSHEDGYENSYNAFHSALLLCIVLQTADLLSGYPSSMAVLMIWNITLYVGCLAANQIARC